MSRHNEFSASSFANQARAQAAGGGDGLALGGDGHASDGSRGELFDFDPAAALSMGTAFHAHAHPSSGSTMDAPMDDAMGAAFTMPAAAAPGLGVGAAPAVGSGDGAYMHAPYAHAHEVYRSIGGAPPAAVAVGRAGGMGVGGGGGVGGGYGGSGAYTPTGTPGAAAYHPPGRAMRASPAKPQQPTHEAPTPGKQRPAQPVAFASALVGAAARVGSSADATRSRHHQVIPSALLAAAAGTGDAEAQGHHHTQASSYRAPGRTAPTRRAALPPQLPRKYQPALSRYLSFAVRTSAEGDDAATMVAGELLHATHAALQQQGTLLVAPVVHTKQAGAGEASGAQQPASYQQQQHHHAWHWRCSTHPGAVAAGQFSARVFTYGPARPAVQHTGAGGGAGGTGWLLELQLLSGGHRWFRATATSVRQAWAAGVARLPLVSRVTHAATGDAALTATAARRHVSAAAADAEAAADDVDMVRRAVAGASRVAATRNELPGAAAGATPGAAALRELGTEPALHDRLVSLARDGGFDVRHEAIGTMTRMVLRSEDALVRLVHAGAGDVWASFVAAYASNASRRPTDDVRLAVACVACLAAMLDVGRVPRDPAVPVAAAVLPTAPVARAMPALVQLAGTPTTSTATATLRHHCVVLLARLIQLPATSHDARQHGAAVTLAGVVEEHRMPTAHPDGGHSGVTKLMAAAAASAVGVVAPATLPTHTATRVEAGTRGDADVAAAALALAQAHAGPTEAAAAELKAMPPPTLRDLRCLSGRRVLVRGAADTGGDPRALAWRVLAAVVRRFGAAGIVCAPTSVATAEGGGLSLTPWTVACSTATRHTSHDDGSDDSSGSVATHAAARLLAVPAIFALHVGVVLGDDRSTRRAHRGQSSGSDDAGGCVAVGTTLWQASYSTEATLAELAALVRDAVVTHGQLVLVVDTTPGPGPA